MALNVSAGTETLHAASFADVDAIQTLIFGTVHHIYTVLSTICYVHSVGATADEFELVIMGHDHHGGADSNFTTIRICRVNAVADETFVFNDKFSFNGHGAAAYTEPLNTAAEQAAIAQQGGTVQEYRMLQTDADVHVDCHVTYIDQNNA